MSKLSKTFASNIVEIRAARGLSQSEMAAKVGVSTSYISMLEREQRSPPLEMVEQFAKALKMHPLDLLQ